MLKGSRAWWDGESPEVSDGVGRNETVGRLIERVAKRFAGTCIARRDIVNPSISTLNQLGLAQCEVRAWWIKFRPQRRTQFRPDQDVTCHEREAEDDTTYKILLGFNRDVSPLQTHLLKHVLPISPTQL